MADSSLKVQRAIVGIAALLLLATAAVLHFTTYSLPSNVDYVGHTMRLGIVLAVFWLALPELRPLKTRIWLLGILVALALTILLRSRILSAILKPQVLGLLAALYGAWIFLRPKRQQKPVR